MFLPTQIAPEFTLDERMTDDQAVRKLGPVTGPDDAGITDVYMQAAILVGTKEVRVGHIDLAPRRPVDGL